MGNAYSESQVCSCDYAHGKPEKIRRKSTGDRSTTSVTKLKSSPVQASERFQIQHDIKDKRKSDVTVTETFISLQNLSLRDQENVINHGSSSSVVPPSAEDLPKNVLYYGWFFSEEISSSIESVVLFLFKHCFAEVNQFQRFILTCCKDADVRGDPFEYYKKPGNPKKDKTYHVTAKFLSRKEDVSYQQLVQTFCDKTFRIRLVGLVFTPRTLGIRVDLTGGQKLIFDEKDTSWDSKLTEVDKIGCADISEQIELELATNIIPHGRINPNPKCKFKDNAEGIMFRRRPTVEPEEKSRAHITVGCAPNVKAKQTGDDLVDIVDLEQRSSTRNGNFQQDFKLKYGTLRQFGRHGHAFVFYASAEMIVPGSFKPFI